MGRFPGEEHAGVVAAIHVSHRGGHSGAPTGDTTRHKRRHAPEDDERRAGMQ